jgi:predicted  nucleic acid-binding Zn-ribbon protein
MNGPHCPPLREVQRSRNSVAFSPEGVWCSSPRRKKSLMESGPTPKESERETSEPVPGATERSRSSRPPRRSSSHLQAALTASGRAEQSLSTLMRAIRDLSSGVSGAREANVQLLRELESMADMLGSANETQLALKNRVGLLEQTLERAHQEASAERAYILEQQDAFIAAMMEDHEQVLVELHRELESAKSRPASRTTTLPDFPGVSEPTEEKDLRGALDAAERTIEKLFAERDRARETLLKLQAQRDEAQATVARLTRERDEARAEQSHSRITDAVRQVIPPSSTPLPGFRAAPTLPPPESPRKPLGGAEVTRTASNPPVLGAVAVGSVRMQQREAPVHPSPPPEELRAALHAPSSTAPTKPPGPEPRSITPPGPPVVTMPPADVTPTAPPPAPANSREPGPRSGGGYSLTNSVAPEHVPTSRVSRAPRR